LRYALFDALQGFMALTPLLLPSDDTTMKPSCHGDSVIHHDHRWYLTALSSLPNNLPTIQVVSGRGPDA